MKIVIIEDENNAKEAITDLINLIDPEIKILGYAESVENAINLINNTKPEVVFLDIHIKNGSGFDVLERIEDYKGKVIFTTAHENYAIKAFKYSALDYLLKPINPVELKSVIKTVKEEIHKDTTYKEMLEVVKHNKKNDENQKIILKTLNSQYIVLISDIIRCKSEGAYTMFYLKKRTILTSKNLKYYDNLLSENGFIRTHQSHLVNTRLIKQLTNAGFVELQNGELIPVSARKKAMVSKRIKNL